MRWPCCIVVTANPSASRSQSWLKRCSSFREAPLNRSVSFYAPYCRSDCANSWSSTNEVAAVNTPLIHSIYLSAALLLLLLHRERIDGYLQMTYRTIKQRGADPAILTVGEAFRVAELLVMLVRQVLPAALADAQAAEVGEYRASQVGATSEPTLFLSASPGESPCNACAPAWQRGHGRSSAE